MDQGDRRVSDQERELAAACRRSPRASRAGGASGRRSCEVFLLALRKRGRDLYRPWGDLDRLEAKLDKDAKRSADRLPTGSESASDAPR